ncbi:hypothetical protein HY634_01755 [Candidatus Uhrbacteria bacterium]|nr:hypothetical protein [Candidatus Uhrbacteria bacterium]
MKVLNAMKRQWQKKVRCTECGALLLVTADDVRVRRVRCSGFVADYGGGGWEQWTERLPCVECPECKKRVDLDQSKLPRAISIKLRFD